jgi:hypothetical protein
MADGVERGDEPIELFFDFACCRTQLSHLFWLENFGLE